MKTSNQENICPYPGLRSFTEDESLYFKGRDTQIEQISRLLEENRFLMVTGASGEGKSSLIYAGLIPNMRAGFFRAQFTNWLVADFRPERSPLANMSKAISEALGADTRTVDTELRRGYSSLIDLYLNSPFYQNESDERWTSMTAGEKQEAKRKAANLVILVDQFEEFFTNPENFSNQAPSIDSQVVVNLALETARIAIKRNLPVYVVFTMRSDFIGQCTAFRGLPEYIGFSQFFVPRLKRKDFKQVIEEPAILSGNRISQRLIERLVYDIAEGVDQLPVLQHALSQVWVAASSGTEEMDLLHYAMVGGMPADELPDKDQSVFKLWFEKLPDFKKAFYGETGLHKIIEIHASILYSQAWEVFTKKHPEKKLSISKCKRVMAITFSCLTKIDNARAVRNRMTLGEITSIINDPELDAWAVSEIISIFREEGNAFIRPYRTEDPETHLLKVDSVLDITHEALIRNWNKLNEWALKEFEYYEVWLDFKKQLSRWKESGKAADYLLPIGPLTFFESWYKEAKPNAAWIARYHDVLQGEDPQKLLNDIREFLKRSARKAIVSRTFIKYGTRRVVTFLSIVIMLVLSGFYWNDAEDKRNERVIAEMRARANELLLSDEVANDQKAEYLLVSERYKNGSLLSALQLLPNDRNRLTVSIEVYGLMLAMDTHFSLPVKEQVRTYIEKQIEALSTIAKTGKENSFLLRQANRYLVFLIYDNYYNPDASFEAKAIEITSMLRALAETFYRDKSQFEPTISTEINFSLQHWLTLGKPSIEQVQELVDIISPNSPEGQRVFSAYYAKGSFEFDGNRLLDNSGGYHLLASLYAVLGNEQGVIECFEKTKEVGDYFFSLGNSGRLFNNYNSIFGYFYQYGHELKLKPLIQWIGKNFPSTTPQSIYKNMVNRSGYLTRMYEMNIFRATRSHRGYIAPNLFLASRPMLEKISSDYISILGALPDKSERNFLLAMQYKRMVMFEDKYNFDRNLGRDTARLNALLDKAWLHFEKVDESHLAAIAAPLTIPYWSDGVRQPKIPNRNLFTYPDYLDGWFSRAYHTDYFYKYMERKGLLEKHFKTPGDAYYLHFWLAKAYEYEPFQGNSIHNYYELDDETLESLAELTNRCGSGSPLAYLLLANRSFERGDTAKGMSNFNKIAFNRIRWAFNQFEYLERTFFVNQLKDLSRNLSGFGKSTEAGKITSMFELDAHKAFSYIFNAERLFATKQDPSAFVYLDSAMTLMDREDFNKMRVELDYRFKLITVLSQVGGEDLNTMAQDILRDFFEQRKFPGILSTVIGVGSEGNYHLARAAMPSTLTETQELNCASYLVWQVCKSTLTETNNAWKSMDVWMGHNQEYIYFVPF